LGTVGTGVWDKVGWWPHGVGNTQEGTVSAMLQKNRVAYRHRRMQVLDRHVQQNSLTKCYALNAWPATLGMYAHVMPWARGGNACASACAVMRNAHHGAKKCATER